MILIYRISFVCALFLIQGAVYASGPGQAVEFIQNQSQWQQDILYRARTSGGHMVLHRDGFSYLMYDNQRLQELHEQSHHHVDESGGEAHCEESIRAHRIRLSFIGARLDGPVVGGDRMAHYYNYFAGRSNRWASGVPAFASVTYQEIYRGINLKVYSSGGHLKYDYVVGRDADPSSIRWRYEGQDNLQIENGGIVLRSTLGDVIEQRPVAYQYIQGKKVYVTCEFYVWGNEAGFIFPKGYDACEELIIDPLLIFSTYSGSTADNWGSTATPGEHGTLYSAGVTNHNNGGFFPATTGSFQVKYAGLYDIGILKYDSAGTRLLYASYLGGSESESAHSLYVNAQNELLVLGSTGSIDFPVTSGAFDTSNGLGLPRSNVITYTQGSDIFITKISSDGRVLLGSSFFGGSSNDGISDSNSPLRLNYGDELRGDIITDDAGNIYVASVTKSTNFPGRNSFSNTYRGGGSDGVLMKVSSDLSSVIWAAFVGGNGDDAAYSLKLDVNGDVLAAGGTTSSNFPTTAGSYLSANQGSVDGWVVRINGDGNILKAGTYIGTPSIDQVYFLDLNASSEVYIYGQTNGQFPIFPSTTAVFNNANSGQFLQKLAPDLSGLLISTVFGSGRGIPDISPTAFLVNDCNNIYMTGWGGELNSRLGGWSTDTRGMRISDDAFQKTTSGSDFYFIVLGNDASEFLYGTYMGGNSSRTHVDGGTSRFDKKGIVYHAVCSGCSAFNPTLGPTSDFPTTPNAWSRINRSQNCNNAAFKFDLSSLLARLQTNSEKRDRPGLSSVCLPDKILFENRSIGGELFEWNFGDGNKLVTADTSAILYDYAEPGRYRVSLKAFDRGTCSVVDSVATFVQVFRTEAKAQDDDRICEGTRYQLSAQGGVLFSWLSGDSLFRSSLQKPFVTPADSMWYYVTITDGNGCVRRDTVSIGVVQSVVPTFDVLREAPCFGETDVTIINTTDSLAVGDSLSFDFADGTVLSNPGLVFTHRYESESVFNVKLTLQREFCRFEGTAVLPIFKLVIPNVITPGDKSESGSVNDRFLVQYGKIPGITPGDFGLQCKLKIYDRWGKLRYEDNNYQYDWSGEGLQAGIYFYELDVQFHGKCRSWIHLIK